MFASIDELKLNRFKPCRCIKPKDLFFRFGQRAAPVFPSSDDVIPMNMDKLESLEYFAEYDAYQSERERAGTEAESYGKNSESTFE